MMVKTQKIRLIKTEAGKKVSLENLSRDPSNVIIEIEGRTELIDRVIFNRGEYVHTLCRSSEGKIMEKLYLNTNLGLEYISFSWVNEGYSRYISFSWVNEGYSRYNKINQKLEAAESQLGVKI